MLALNYWNLAYACDEDLDDSQSDKTSKARRALQLTAIGERTHRQVTAQSNAAQHHCQCVACDDDMAVTYQWQHQADSGPMLQQHQQSDYPQATCLKDGTNAAQCDVRQ